ncbi:hypothetical protein PBI_MULCIBER_38 [Mycobacterium phage Mulciber]|uniref:hypothetical protein n=1 Tax=Mycobacterium phage Mulciber TaxID=1805459 RepID=UPI00078D9D50|nr:hypothetical protein BJD74_gp70 [Mycobacterium phage Mulciber]AXH50718.1 hypothetical protein SEA_SNAPE_38 [Mycobacterium phage Snape]QBI97870.1 hypothetical protein SEA_ORANGE_38 [Mycobacterium phage Orange]QBI98409.1 hypothetical protein SEA_MUNCH_39 [Mycobacterium phage Munch]QBP32511.1 hypothetical protein SEA_FIBONACCI_38 [Mycobacterium phage Fibonacci]QFG05017.1 hypothetical protein SEA_HUTC2_38 [Mycobacterium phage Hutc2]QGZ16454.1 hypothetical protein SEA_ANEEM_39 [Mycobacterium ph
MMEDQDHEFFDILYQQWAQTTGVEKGYWVVEHDPDEHLPWQLFAVDQVTEERRWVGSFHREEDADFVAGLHGALPDLIRRLHDATDEAVRKDEANDIAQGQLAEALLEVAGLKAEILELEKRLDS